MNRRSVERAGRAGLFTLALTVVPLVAHLPTTSLVLESLIKGRADCSGMMNPTATNFPFDAIVVPGAGIIRTSDGTIQPSIDGQMRLDAAAVRFLQGEAPRIILLSGVIEPEYDILTSRRFLQRTGGQSENGSWSIPDSAILEEANSVNTATNMEQLKNIVEQEKLGRLKLITNTYHLVRAGILACLRGVAISSESAEEILVEQDPKRIPFINEKYNSGGMFITRLKEYMETMWLLWDNNSSVTTFFRRITS